MANPNINVWGATYNGVTGVTLPTSGGGTATFPWVEGSETKTQNGTYDVTNLAEVVVNVSGGGGASNVVTGTFKGTSSGVLDVALSYSGSGYPIAISIFPTEGSNNSSGTFGTTIQRYAAATFFGAKAALAVPPTYASVYDPAIEANYAQVVSRYKSSASSATSYSNGAGSTQRLYTSSNPGNSSANVCTIQSPTQMKVYIASTSYGFMKNIEYTYCIMYSS